MAQHIRLSQFVITYGPGSIIEGVEGPRVIPTSDIGLFISGSPLVPWDYEISDQRMSQGLLNGSRIFRLPSNAELGLPESRYVYRTKPFPQWRLCLNSAGHSGDFYVLYQAHSCPVCGNSGRKGREAIRFVKACPKGHLDEVDWYFLAHGNRTGCQQSRWFKWHGGGGALSKVRVECPDCGSSAFSLGWAYGQNWRCSGRYPEREPLNSAPIRPGCSKDARIIQRQASNLRIPELLTLFSIPPRYTNLHNLLQIRPIYDNILGSNPTSKTQFAQILNNLAQRNRIGQSVVSEILKYSWQEIESAVQDVLSPIPSSYRELIMEEFNSLIHGSEMGIPPVRGSIPQSPVVIEINPNMRTQATGPRGAKFRITPILRLRTVTVQRGYRRDVNTEDVPKIVPVSFPDPVDPQQKWYPGVEFLGEGIFIILEDQEFMDFSTSDSISSKWLKTFSNSSSYPDHLFRDPQAREELHPLFVWWHTLSHLLIRAISAEAGYSSSSIRERIYFENTPAKLRGGILLYATQPGSEGTLGGLIALAPYFQDILGTVFDQLDSCSGDPLCKTHSFQNGFYNGAACYGCLLLSETSCDHRNMWLDRNILLENLP